MPELPLVGDEFAGYQLRAVLGRGGMSVVYQAENPRLGNVIALKVLAPELATDDIFRARFLEESRIAAAMNHPHVIPIHDTGSSDGLLFIAMRYVSGTNLGQMIKKRGRLQPETAVLLLSQAARALDAAHRRGLVHRDVKPANLLVERGNDDSDPDHLYLADFGITKMANGRTGLTSTGQFVGTVDYVAPEQIRGLSVLGMADQYSLGCVLYECLTGRVVFEKDLNEAIMWAHMEEHPTRPTLLRPDLPPEVDEMFARVLAKQPGDRYGSCREFMNAASDALGPMAADASANRSLRALQPGPPPADRREIAHDRGVRGRRDLTASIARPGLQSLEDPPYANALPDPAPALADEALYQAGAPYPDWAAPHAAEGQGAESPPPDETEPADPRSGSGSGSGSHPRRRRGRRVSVLLLAGALALAVGIGITIGAWTGLGSGRQPGAGPSTGASAGGSAGAALTPPTLSTNSTKTLKQALDAVNSTVWTAGYLPQKSCVYLSTGYARCGNPYTGIAEAVFQNYSSSAALYQAYEAAIKQANNGHFLTNTQDCGTSAPPSSGAEISWNHFGEHTSAYSIAQLETGKLNAASQAAGRVFCDYNSGSNSETIIWTQTDGNMLGEVTGAPHLAVWSWWLHVHHNIAFNGQPLGALDKPGPDLFPSA
jgi:serine/threonine protein kinase